MTDLGKSLLDATTSHGFHQPSVDSAGTPPTFAPWSQLSAHGGTRIEIPGPYGPIIALDRWPDGPDLNVTVVMLPGFTGSKEDFAPLLDPIADAGIRVLAIDLPGQFESPGPDDEAAYRPRALGQVIRQLMDTLAADGRRMLLLGHSYGGLVARAAVLAETGIVGLTLLGSGPAELPAGYRRAALDQGEPVLRRHGIAAAQRFRESHESTSPEADARPAELQEFMRHRFLSSSPAGLLGMSYSLRHEPDLVTKLARSLRRINAHCLVACGESDDAWSVASQRDMADRLEADFAAVPAAKHSPNTENPEGLLALLLPTWRAWLRY